jgi:hypothetical protein
MTSKTCEVRVVISLDHDADAASRTRALSLMSHALERLSHGELARRIVYSLMNSRFEKNMCLTTIAVKASGGGLMSCADMITHAEDLFARLSPHPGILATLVIYDNERQPMGRITLRDRVLKFEVARVTYNQTAMALDILDPNYFMFG